MGMFVDNAVPVVVYGKLCPALWRMPLLGNFKAEAVLITTHSVALVLDALTTLLTVYAWQTVLVNVSGLWELSLNRPMFHSMLNSSGSELFNLNEVVHSLDKAALYASDVIIRSGKVFASTSGYKSLEPVLAGTTKILQHSACFVPLQGPLARQYAAVLFKEQTGKVTNVTLTTVKGKAWGFVMGTATGIMAQVSGLKVSLCLLRKMTLKQIKKYTRLRGALS
jgi:hypothetical protein